jgi:hypothetical protein
MINNAKLTLIATLATFTIALSPAALAQSAYTTGTAASSAAAGYPTLYEYGSGLYDYAPDHGDEDSAHYRYSRHLTSLRGFVDLAYGGHNFDRTADAFNSTDDDLTGCGKGRLRDQRSDQCRGPADISKVGLFRAGD